MGLKRIECDEDVTRALDALGRIDPRLARIRRDTGPVPLRLRSGGLPGLLRIVVGQQLSVRSAESTWARITALAGDFAPRALLALADDDFREAGLSRQKTRTFRAAAEAARNGLDFDRLGAAPAEAAHAALTTIPGIGPWTADIYLMFCAGHPDIFPVGDLALRRAVIHGLDLDPAVRPGEIAGLARAWSPHRAAAARLLWAYYAVLRDGKVTARRSARARDAGVAGDAMPV